MGGQARSQSRGSCNEHIKSEQRQDTPGSARDMCEIDSGGHQQMRFFVRVLQAT